MVPAAARVELADELEEVGGGGVEVRKQQGDLVAQPVHRGAGSLQSERWSADPWFSVGASPDLRCRPRASRRDGI
jgi:hypothetical protein